MNNNQLSLYTCRIFKFKYHRINFHAKNMMIKTNETSFQLTYSPSFAANSTQFPWQSKLLAYKIFDNAIYKLNHGRMTISITYTYP